MYERDCQSQAQSVVCDFFSFLAEGWFSCSYEEFPLDPAAVVCQHFVKSDPPLHEGEAQEEGNKICVRVGVCMCV